MTSCASVAGGDVHLHFVPSGQLFAWTLHVIVVAFLLKSEHINLLIPRQLPLYGAEQHAQVSACVASVACLVACQ